MDTSMSSTDEVREYSLENEQSDTSCRTWELDINDHMSPATPRLNINATPNRELPVAYHTRSSEVISALNAKSPRKRIVFDSIAEEDEEQEEGKREKEKEEGGAQEGSAMVDLMGKGQMEDKREQEHIGSPITILNEMQEIQAHLWTHEKLAEEFSTDLGKGLSQQEAMQRQQRDGKNVLFIKHGRHPLLGLLFSLFEGFGYVLWGSMILCLIAYFVARGTEGDLYNLGLAILLFVVIIAQGLVTFYQTHKSSKLMEVLKQVLPSQCIVCRDGLEESIAAEELVVGDIVTIHTGYKVPADVRILECKEARVDNSLLTGESEPQQLKENATSTNPFETHNLSFYGTVVVEGQFKGVVIATAQNTLTGRLVTQMSRAKPAKAPLQSEINKFAMQIVIGALLIGVIIVVTWAAWLNRTYHGFLTPATLLVTIVSVMVACLPDGMPLAVQTTMMLVAKRMLRVNVLVKSLPIIETLGATTAILTDKTGTLTENKMTVSSLYLDGRVVPIDESSLQALDHDDASVFSSLLKICALCNRATQDASGNIIGDASETALLNFHTRTLTLGSPNAFSLQLKNPKLSEIPFNSKNKWQASIHRTSDGHRSY